MKLHNVRSRSVNALATVILLALTTVSFSASAQDAPSMHGTASWYGEEFAGRATANGEIFEPILMTAAHRTLPFGSIVDVKNSKTGQTVRVRINDRGPFVGDRLIDLSYAAAKELGILDTGSGDVDVTVVSLGKGDREPPAPYTITITQAQQTAPVRSAFAEPATAAPSPQPVAVTEPVAAPVQVAAATPPPAPVPAPAPQPAAAAPKPAPAASNEPPQVDFPLPSDVNAAKTAAPKKAAAAPAPVDVTNVQVIEERHGVETRRQVAPDGKAVQSVPARADAAPPAKAEAPARNEGSSAHTRRFLVQVGAFSVEANAIALKELLDGFSLRCHIDRDKLWRVRMGPYDTREEAIRVRSDLETKGISAIVIPE